MNDPAEKNNTAWSNSLAVDDYELRVTKITVAPEGHPVFSEHATAVEIVDEAGGEFVAITQESRNSSEPGQRISIDVEEWPAIRMAVDLLIGACRTPRE